MNSVKSTVNWLVALGLIGFYAYTSLISLDGTKSMQPAIIFGFFGFVYILMYGADKTRDLVEVIPDELMNETVKDVIESVGNGNENRDDRTRSRDPYQSPDTDRDQTRDQNQFQYHDREDTGTDTGGGKSDDDSK